MKPFPLWKYLVLAASVVVGMLFAAPNLFGDDPSVQISTAAGELPPPTFGEQVGKVLGSAGIEPLSNGPEEGRWIVRLDDETAQLAAADALRRDLGRDYVVALNLAPKTPQWLRDLGAQPMNLGLDLRGGVHFLLEVDVDDVRTRAVERIVDEVPALLRKEGIRYSGRRQAGDAGVLEFADAERLEAARRAIAGEFPEYSLEVPPQAPLTLQIRLSEEEAKRIVDFAVQQNLTTLRNRVNQLGVAEPLVQRQGADRIVVQLPGVQDTTRVKDLLGATATLEYRAVAEDDPYTAASSGIVPVGTQLFYTRDGNRPVLLKREVIAGGVNLIDAAATVDENGGPAVSVTLDGVGAKRMFAFTEKNVGKPMAVLFKEREVITNYNAKGEPIREQRQIEEVISVASVRGVFGKRFQTTGLTSKEAHDLALLLKAGALAAPVVIVEERTIGPSMGADNIERGQLAALIGFLAVVVFMAVYYRLFGLVANAALLLNLILLVAAMSLIQATLTMPGIAGIVLTLGMAVDANVLIYERIREELARGSAPLAAVDAGYDRAFLTIADSQITTLIAAVVLFALGSGPVKGFAVTLTIGIATSMFTAIIGTRAIIHLIYRGKSRLRDLPV
ncbi:protein translocase subunit SecD [Sinimarinibacterium flocculans]|uniref:Protein translocase subunit SecD n=1 Tax=Sinimarinibacterium flocculans TaxID=985250 RepID=A0A318E607_9GAMM|nr:protein translocase subunit SecD [Sinimarinibacterium flocculans]PXV63980.1 preprotein translocase subunit SecD [Sinimarinibacterium flocculans]